ncbi:MAG: LysR family transcriptional regulator [Symploca sp. SIO1B1]|nr:LysR family transcriptional regulator [Symploca sp. SIO1C2]NER93825.1 LysR family transcriptional regulator [Symploca sp. SIO1B1]
MSDRISTLRLFCRVATTGSFTAAGKEIDLSQPSVSRIISKLEKDLGVALFVRSTHAVKLTEAGADYLARIDPILAALEEANHLVRSDGKLQGRLRVGVAISFAVREIIPRLPNFLAQHPDLNVDLVLTDSFQDLIDQAIDVAIRFGPLRDSTMVARRLGLTQRLIAASPAYLAKAGTPKTPADLAGHQVIIGPSSMGATGWTFQKDGKTLSVRVDGQLMVTVNEASTAAALAGMGIISTSFWGCRAELENGELVQVLADWEIGTVEVNALLAGGKSAKPSARAFADYLVASFRNSASI